MKSHTKIIAGLLLLSVLFCLPASSEGLPPTRAEEWPATCNTFKKTYLSSSEFYVTFSDKPRPKVQGQLWTLKIKGLEMPIPAVSYQHLYIGRESEFPAEYSVMLISSSRKMTIDFFIEKNEPIKDMFALWSKDELAGGETPEGIGSTKEIFGGPGPVSDLIILGHEKTPDDLTCRKEEWIGDARIATALALKGVSSKGLTAAYRGVGRNLRMTSMYREDDKVVHMLLLLFPENPGRMYGMKYIMSQDDEYRDTGLLFGDLPEGNIGAPPAWLKTLNLALASGDAEKWNLFLAEAQKAGFSAGSIQKSRQSLGLAK